MATNTGAKAVDIVAIDPDRCCWAIEVKDYRIHPRTKVIDIADEVALKARDSLAVLVAASANAVGDEQTFARKAVRCERIRVVLHLEQAEKPSKLFPLVANPANVEQQLRQRVKAIDAHPRVVNKLTPIGSTWDVN
jgi:hypothetical protein